jgi:hypothetical protein
MDGFLWQPYIGQAVGVVLDHFHHSKWIILKAKAVR